MRHFLMKDEYFFLSRADEIWFDTLGEILDS